MRHTHPINTILPYTTLFRSLQTIPDFKDIQTIVIDDNSDKKHNEALVNIKLKCTDRNIEFYKNETGKKGDRKSTRLNSSHVAISYAGFCLKKKEITRNKIE